MGKKNEYKLKSLISLKKQSEIRNYRGKLKWSDDLVQLRKDKS